MKMNLVFNTSSNLIHCFQLVNLNLKRKGKNQVCGVRLIPELELFPFQEYGPLISLITCFVFQPPLHIQPSI